VRSKLTPINIQTTSSEELGLTLGELFEQGFVIQQQIYAITTELTRRRDAAAEQDDTHDD
jgi:hypothetical protein